MSDDDDAFRSDPDDAFADRPEFELLSDEHRLAIVRALADRLREDPSDPTLGFSDLRRAAGIRDSGNFNYHLDRLTGTFVRKSDDGYRITTAGMRVVGALIVGAYGAGERYGPRDVGADCPVCGESLSAVYEEGLLVVSCPNDHSFRNPLPPGAVDERDVAGIVDLATRRIHQNLELAVAGTCPNCYARIDWSVSPDLDPEFPHLSEHCERCGVSIDVPIAAALLQDRRVVDFYHDHGVDVRTRPIWSPEFYTAVDATASADPVRIDVVIELDGDDLSATLDRDLTVVDVVT